MLRESTGTWSFPMRVFITGGTGLVGARLIQQLEKRQDKVDVLTRRPDAAREQFGPTVNVVEGDPTKPGPWMEAASECDGVINLAGENLFGRRWNEDFKKVIRDSRVQATANVAQALAKNPRRPDGAPRVLVNASAIGIYGPHSDEELTETSSPGSDFLATVCVDWEVAAKPAEAAGARVCRVRIGVVLDKRGGALAQLLTPFKLGAGGPVASGRQWMSWIHHEDLVGLLLLALDRPEATGPMNGTAPHPVINKEFSKALGRALHRPAFMPLPGFVLRLRIGAAAEVVVNGQRVLPKKALELGYTFKFPTIDGALIDAVAG
jgi:uncharacterized protein (TIGR01777 family)